MQAGILASPWGLFELGDEGGGEQIEEAAAQWLEDAEPGTFVMVAADAAGFEDDSDDEEDDRIESPYFLLVATGKGDDEEALAGCVIKFTGSKYWLSVEGDDAYDEGSDGGEKFDSPRALVAHYSNIAIPSLGITFGTAVTSEPPEGVYAKRRQVFVSHPFRKAPLHYCTRQASPGAKNDSRAIFAIARTRRAVV